MELSELMRLWRAARTEIDAIEQQIAEQVLKLKKTQDVDDVRASYSGGRKTYDYQTACKDVPAEVIEAYTKIEKKVDYRALCKEEGIDAPVLNQTPPSVTLKLIEDKTFDVSTPFPGA